MMKSFASAIVAAVFVLGCGGSKKAPEKPDMDDDDDIEEGSGYDGEPDEASEESAVPGGMKAPEEGESDGNDEDDSEMDESGEDPDMDDPGDDQDEPE